MTSPPILDNGKKRRQVQSDVVLYLQLGQLSQLLCSIKDELSALEETGRQWGRWKKGR